MKTTVKIFVALLFVAGGTLVISSAIAQVSIGPTPSFEVETAPYGPEIISFTTSPNPATAGITSVTFTMKTMDISGVRSAIVQVVDSNNNIVDTVDLYDDGQHNDGAAGDGIFVDIWNLLDLSDGLYGLNVQATDALGNTTPEEGFIEVLDVLIIGEGVCVTDSDCTDSSLPLCCGGTCREANLCLSDTECVDNDTCTIDVCNLDSCPNVCSNTTITTCDMVLADGCCPSGCDSSNDADCVGDTTPPVVSITDPTDGATLTVDTYTVVVSATDPESGIERVEFRLSGTLMGTQYFDSPAGSGVYSWVWDVSGVQNGSYMLAAVVYNNEGLGAEDAIGINVSRPASLAPVNVSITSPAAGSTFASGTTFNVVVHAEDDVDIASISLFSVDNGLINEELLTGDNNISVNVTFGVGANSLAYIEEVINHYASEPSGFKLPFIPVAWAAEDDDCTTTTNTYWDAIYGVAYDSDNQSTLSPQIPVGRTVTSTNCIPTIPSTT